MSSFQNKRTARVAPWMCVIAAVPMVACLLQDSTGDADDVSEAPLVNAAEVQESQATQGASRSVQSTFALSSDANFFTVDTGAGLTFKVRRRDDGASTRSTGDIASMVFDGVEYQNAARGSQINSGFDYLYAGISRVDVHAAQVDPDTIRITVRAGALTHYYLARRGLPHIYMATRFTAEPDTLGMCRFIVRIPSDRLPNGPIPSEIRGTTRTVEASDVFALPSGETRSKHYSNRRLIDWSYTGASGDGVAVWMVRDRAEGGSGGPFYRSLINQGGADQELYEITNYGEAQTEPFRPGILNGPYTLVFTHGEPPPALDTGWLDQAGLEGWVPAGGRGRVAGVGIANRDPKFEYVAALSNATAQYFTRASSSTGYFSIPGVLPGHYALTVYKGELAVASRSVDVSAGGTTIVHTITVDGDPDDAPVLWRIGAWDGTPAGFMNAASITSMHPSDPRLEPWTPADFVVGESDPAYDFPCYQWKDVNGSLTIRFALAPGQVQERTVRVGITTTQFNGRPRITVNGWTSPIPSPSTQPSTRTMTVGTYRGNNTTFTFRVPASAFVTGTNTMSISVVSGSGSTGFLSAGVAYDAIDLR